jgi:hypothetical protein
VVGHPIGGGRTAGLGWPKPPHGPWGWSGHPQWPNLKKKKIVWPWVWPDHPQRPRVGFVHLSHPEALGGGLATPKGQTIFFFFFWPLGVAGPPPKAIRWLQVWRCFAQSHPTPKLGWSGHPQWGGQPSLYYFYYLFF